MTINDGTQKGTKLTQGDYVHFGGFEVYQVRGDGHRPQLHLDAELTQARQEADRIYRTAVFVLPEPSTRRVVAIGDKHGIVAYDAALLHSDEEMKHARRVLSAVRKVLVT